MPPPTLLFILYLPFFFSTEAACPNSCNNNGRCNPYNVCSCFGDFTGHDCSLRKCPTAKAWSVIVGVDEAHTDAECSGRGICDRTTAVCKCQTGFTGDACQFTECPNNCNDHGECISMKMLADDSVRALDHHDGLPYAYDSIWDATKMYGCVCDYPFDGNTCGLKVCPRGDDPLTTGQTEEIQVIKCSTTYTKQQVTLHYDTAPTLGDFILRFGSKHTKPIAHDAAATAGSGTSMQEMLVALTEIAAATVTKTSPTNSRVWDITFPSGNTVHNYLVPGWRREEVQSFICAADGGSFGITYDTNTALTGIAYNAAAADIKTKLESLAVISKVTVTYASGTSACATAGNTITITFTEMLDRKNPQDLPELKFDSTNAGTGGLTLTGGTAFLDSVAKEVVKGIDTCRTIEVQSIVCQATSGSFALAFDGTTLSDIAYSTTAADLTTRLESIASVIDVDITYSNGTTACTSTGNTITVAFHVVTTKGASGDGDLALITADKTNGGTTPLSHTTSDNLNLPTSFTEVHQGSVCIALNQPYATNPKKQIVSQVTEGGGSFKVSYRGSTTGSIPALATAAELREHLVRLPTITDAEITYTNTDACTTPANLIKVNFTQNFGDLPSMSVDGTLLSTGSAISVTTSGATIDGIQSYNGTKENEFCSGRGVCDQVKGIGCACFLGYSSSNGRGAVGTATRNRGDCGANTITMTTCPGEIACSGHGSCTAGTNKCNCAEGWMNGACSERTCPKGESWFSYPSAANSAHRDMTECSSVGACDRSSGVCTCQKPYTGAACEHMICGGASIECSGHGECMTLQQLAPEITSNGDLAGFTYGLDPNNDHTWDAKKIRTCKCDAGYTGYDCSLRECPRGDDPGTFNDVKEIQVVQCTASAGTFTLTFRQATTAAIAFDATAAQVKAALELLPTITDVSVVLSSGTAACTTSNVVMQITFNTELAKLPPLTGDKSLLKVGAGAAGTGSITVAAHGTILQGVASVTGTRENAYCSNRGKCDFSTGICSCDDQYTSSNGFGAAGDLGDCGFHYLKSEPTA